MTIVHLTPTAQGTSPESPPFVTLVDANVLRRAGTVSLALGTVLALANQSGAIFGEVGLEFLPLALVYVTPFVVVTISQVLGIQRALRDVQRGDVPEAQGSAFLATVASHGIPYRALVLGLITGTVNTSIVITTTLLDTGALANLSFAPIVQAFVLPTLFGLLSQAISYRRVVRVCAS